MMRRKGTFIRNGLVETLKAARYLCLN